MILVSPQNLEDKQNYILGLLTSFLNILLLKNYKSLLNIFHYYLPNQQRLNYAKEKIGVDYIVKADDDAIAKVNEITNNDSLIWILEYIKEPCGLVRFNRYKKNFDKLNIL